MEQVPGTVWGVIVAVIVIVAGGLILYFIQAPLEERRKLKEVIRVKTEERSERIETAMAEHLEQDNTHFIRFVQVESDVRQINEKLDTLTGSVNARQSHIDRIDAKVDAQGIIITKIFETVTAER